MRNVSNNGNIAVKEGEQFVISFPPFECQCSFQFPIQWCRSKASASSPAASSLKELPKRITAPLQIPIAKSLLSTPVEKALTRFEET